MTEKKKEDNKIGARGLKTIEKLHHFQCYSCNKWWSIGDANTKKEIWYCPWCGEKQKFILIKK
jgi:predicted RNA-binding Zn-ribbon protein involved in translation (DUF1610 family)